MDEALQNKTAIRARFTKSINNNAPIPLGTNDIIIYCPGTKKPGLVNNVLSAVISAGKTALGDNFVFAFRKHPGEKPEKKEDKTFFELFFRERESLFKDICLLSYGNANSPQLVASSDLTVFFSGPTESIVAAFKRMSTIYFTDDENRANLVNAGLLDGKWFVGELDGSRQVTTQDEMAEAIKLLLTPEGQTELRKHQKENFPLPLTWEIAPEIVRFLENY